MLPFQAKCYQNFFQWITNSWCDASHATLCTHLPRLDHDTITNAGTALSILFSHYVIVCQLESGGYLCAFITGQTIFPHGQKY